ncbi:MAG: hypothetical protein LBQ94_00105 [Treponema sp.]|nr:hypothetical protein [Treponema sp.]
MIVFTDEQYDILCERVAKMRLHLVTRENVLTRQEMLLKALDEEAVNNLKMLSEALHKPPLKIVFDMIREEMAKDKAVGAVSVAKV